MDGLNRPRRTIPHTVSEGDPTAIRPVRPAGAFGGVTITLGGRQGSPLSSPEPRKCRRSACLRQVRLDDSMQRQSLPPSFVISAAYIVHACDGGATLSRFDKRTDTR